MTNQKRGQITIDGLVVPDVEAIMRQMEKWLSGNGTYEPPLGMSLAEKDVGKQIILTEEVN